MSELVFVIPDFRHKADEERIFNIYFAYVRHPDAKVKNYLAAIGFAVHILPQKPLQGKSMFKLVKGRSRSGP
jgi:hypothetical protein